MSDVVEKGSFLVGKGIGVNQRGPSDKALIFPSDVIEVPSEDREGEIGRADGSGEQGPGGVARVTGLPGGEVDDTEIQVPMWAGQAEACTPSFFDFDPLVGGGGERVRDRVEVGQKFQLNKDTDTPN
jgi:hypothetical protein